MSVNVNVSIRELTWTCPLDALHCLSYNAPKAGDRHDVYTAQCVFHYMHGSVCFTICMGVCELNEMVGLRGEGAVVLSFLCGYCV